MHILYAEHQLAIWPEYRIVYERAAHTYSSDEIWSFSHDPGALGEISSAYNILEVAAECSLG